MNDEDGRGRGERRHQADRAKARGRKMAERCAFDEDHVERLTHRFATDRKPCSCYACGNPRKYFNKPTRQELKRNEQDRDDEKDC